MISALINVIVFINNELISAGLEPNHAKSVTFAVMAWSLMRGLRAIKLRLQARRLEG